jgi:hypothetical protein
MQCVVTITDRLSTDTTLIGGAVLIIRPIIETITDKLSADHINYWGSAYNSL